LLEKTECKRTCTHSGAPSERPLSLAGMSNNRARCTSIENLRCITY
jgi:hypothetical protein